MKANSTKRSTAATETRVPSGLRDLGSIDRHLRRHDFFRPPRRVGSGPAGRGYGAGRRLPPRSFLRDKLSLRFASSRNRPSAGMHLPGGNVAFRNYLADLGNRSRPGIGRASRPAWEAACALCLLANAASAVAGLEPAQRMLPPPEGVALALALIGCELY